MRSNVTTSRLALGLVLLLALGACSEQEREVVVNEQVPADQQVAEGGGEAGGGEGGGSADQPDAVWMAEQLAFTGAPDTIPAGEVVIGLEITGGVPHNVVFEGFEGDSILVEGDQAGLYTGTVDVPPGTYTYYCSVPGHRAAGMEGSVTAG